MNITKQEALLYLESDEENWKDDLELKLFELKKDLLRRVLIPKLLIKRAEKVEVWYQASQVLLGQEIAEISKIYKNLPDVQVNNTKTIINLYRVFETELMKLQLKLTQSNEAKVISEIIYSMALIEKNRQQILFPIADQLFINEDKNSFDVKLSEDSQTGVIISELKQFDKDQITEKKELLLLPNFKKDLQRILRSN